MRSFKSDANVAMLKELLQDSQSVTEGKTKPDNVCIDACDIDAFLHKDQPARDLRYFKTQK